MINKNMEVTSLIFKEVRQPKLPQRSDEATLFFDGKSLQFINYKGKRNSLGSILQETIKETYEVVDEATKNKIIEVEKRLELLFSQLNSQINVNNELNKSNFIELEETFKINSEILLSRLEELSKVEEYDDSSIQLRLLDVEQSVRNIKVDISSLQSAFNEFRNNFDSYVLTQKDLKEKLLEIENKIPEQIDIEAGEGVTVSKVNGKVKINALVRESKGGGGGVRELKRLKEVAINNPQINDIFSFDGNNWVNSPAPQPIIETTLLLGEDVAAFRAIYIADDGLAYYASPSIDANKIVYITKESKSQGEQIRVAFIAEKLNNPSWNFTPGNRIFVSGNNGQISQVAPIIDNVFAIGVALSTNLIQIISQNNIVLSS